MKGRGDSLRPYDRRMRVLVVEDEVGIAEFLRRALEGDGTALTVASDGAHGEALAPSGDFDLVLLGRRVPGLRPRVVVGIALLSIASFMAAIITTRISQPWAFFGSPTRAWEFGAGALAYFACQRHWGWRVPTRVALAAIGMASMVAHRLIIGDGRSQEIGRATSIVASLIVIATAGTLLLGALERFIR